MSVIKVGERYWLWNYNNQRPRTVFRSRFPQRINPHLRIIYTRLAKLLFNLNLTESNIQ